MERVLHVGNIAHNAYFNELVLRKKGMSGCVIHFDAYHFASCPEWLGLGDQVIDREILGDDFFPNFFQFEKSNDLRPEWFFQGPVYQAMACVCSFCESGFDINDQNYKQSRSLMDFLRYKIIYKKRYEESVAVWNKEKLEKSFADLNVHETWIDCLTEGFNLDCKRHEFVGRLNNIIGANLGSINLPLSKNYIKSAIKPNLPSKKISVLEKARNFIRPPMADSKRADSRIVQKAMRDIENLIAIGIIQISEERYDPALRADLKNLNTLPYHQVIPYWDRIRSFFDHQIFYGGHVILPAMSTKPAPYGAYEHGTIRSLPFEDSDFGRLIRESYKHASVVMITNADYINAKKRLAFDERKIVYVPHGFDDHSCSKFLQQFKKEKRDGEMVRFFAPARHRWVNGNDGNSKGNDMIVKAVSDLVAQGHHNFCVTVLEYGEDVDATKDLINKLAVSEYFNWHKTMPRHELWQWYLNADAVLDQFHIPAIGQIGVEAIALGSRLINADDGSMTKFFEDRSPILAANTTTQIAKQMIAVIRDRDDQSSLGAYSRSWFLRNHSSEAIAKKLMNALDILRSAGAN